MFEQNGDTRPLRDILGSEDLERLRGNFDEEVLLKNARQGIGQKLPDSLGFIGSIETQLYRPATNQTPEQYREFARQRESQLITLFMVQSRGQGLFLSIHFYWGLMVGLSPAQILNQVLLVGMYGGIQVLNAGLMTLELTLRFLKKKVDEEQTSTMQLLEMIHTPFPNLN